MPTPIELYPEWPNKKIRSNEVHEAIRVAALTTRQRMDVSDLYPSIRKLERATGVPSSTSSDFLNGKSWPTALTIAAIEAGIGAPIWPRPATSQVEVRENQLHKLHTNKSAALRERDKQAAKRLGTKKSIY